MPVRTTRAKRQDTETLPEVTAVRLLGGCWFPDMLCRPGEKEQFGDIVLDKHHISQKYGQELREQKWREKLESEELYLRHMWQQHADRLMYQFVFGGEETFTCRGGEPRAGERPWAWWCFNALEPLGDDETEQAYLRRHGLMSEEEERLLSKRKYPPRAFDNNAWAFGFFEALKRESIQIEQKAKDEQ